MIPETILPDCELIVDPLDACCQVFFNSCQKLQVVPKNQDLEDDLGP